MENIERLLEAILTELHKLRIEQERTTNALRELSV